MKNKRNKLWRVLLTVLFFTVAIVGCRDEDESFLALCPEVVANSPADGATSIPLNQTITATFNDEMNPASINSSSMSLTKAVTTGGTTSQVNVEGTITYDEATKTVSFVPTEDLTPNDTYTVTIDPKPKNKLGNTLQVPFVWSFTTGSIPTVTSTIPANLATAVPLNQVISATFSEPMDALTITNTSFTLLNGTTLVAGSVTYSGTTASFTPSINLLPETSYKGTITVAAKNASGIPMASDYVWNFNTGIPPTVTSTEPVDLANNVPLNQVVKATFSVPMDASTITGTSFTLFNGTTQVNGVVTYTGSTASFTPNINLLSGVSYKATITTAVKTPLGIEMANDYVWNFSTGSAPTVTSTVPLDLANNVPLNQVVQATFSVPMDATTITGTSFTLYKGTTQINGVVTYSGSTASFTPNVNLSSGSSYKATITTAAKNTTGTAIANDYIWNFSTVAPSGPQAINLNSLTEYGIISGVGVSNNAGASEIHDMNVGIYPGVRSSITGFFVVDGGPGLIFNGAFHAADDLLPTGINAALNQAKIDLVNAYNEAAGATLPAPSIAPADLGGKTLAPGIYTSASTMLLQNGDLTLDAQGDENAVWIFQVGSGFTSVGGAGGNVILSGGAKSKNVYWQVGSSAIIGDNTSFKGNILAFSSITMNSNAVAEGRMLARNGSVILTNKNTITRPPN